MLSDEKLTRYLAPPATATQPVTWAGATNHTCVSNYFQQQQFPQAQNGDCHRTVLLPSDSFLNNVRGDDALNSLCKTLVPSEKFMRRCQETLDLLTEFTWHHCSSFNVSGLLLGGSVGQRTCLNFKSDLDIVMFVSGLRTMNDFLRNLETLKTQLSFELTRWKSNQKYLRVVKITTLAVKIQLRTSVFDDFLDVDLVLAFDNLACHASLWSLYAEMNRLPTSLARYEYSSSLVQLQLTFIANRLKRSSLLIDLVRLVKYWRKSHFKQIAKDYRSILPTSYAFELVVIHLWETAGSPTSFKLKRALKSVFMSLANAHEIYAYWTDFYQPTMFPNKASKTMNKPYILDPVNPFNNVCEFYSVETWNIISAMAVASCYSPMLRDVRLPCSHQWN